MRLVQRLTVAFAAVLRVAPAHAELIAHKDWSAAMAMTIAETALTARTANGYRVWVTVLGRTAEVIARVRGDNALPHTFENSFRTAYTSRTFRVASGEIAKRYKEDPAIFQVHLSNAIPAQGGPPIKVGDDVVGAVGVSGAPGGEKDEVCAKAGIEKVAEALK